jgi:hypothetical protein
VNGYDETVFQRIFHVLTHGDAREHVLHHTKVRALSRPFPGAYELPPDPVYISLWQYLGVLWRMATGAEEPLTAAAAPRGATDASEKRQDVEFG